MAKSRKLNGPTKKTKQTHSPGDGKSKNKAHKYRTRSKIERSAYIFPIVGIGASAGGLEAIRLLLQALPTDTGMAFIVIQHEENFRSFENPHTGRHKNYMLEPESRPMGAGLELFGLRKDGSEISIDIS